MQDLEFIDSISDMIAKKGAVQTRELICRKIDEDFDAYKGRFVSDVVESISSTL